MRTRIYPPNAYDRYENCDELEGTLGNLKIWLEELIANHGEEAKISFDVEGDDNDAIVTFTIVRDATPEELEKQREAEEKYKADSRERRRMELERLKKEFPDG